MQRLGYTLLALAVVSGCSDEGDGTKSREDGGLGAPDAQVESDAHTESPDGGQPVEGALTYWHDMVPLLEKHCLSCHQSGGIGPFPLDSYEQAKEKARLIKHSTETRSMPPWHATSDGSCGKFQGSLALTDQEIATIGKWVDDGAQEGTKGEITLPAPDQLTSAKEYATPLYVPEIAGGPLAQADDYRCFMIDADVEALRFITGYDIKPGTDSIVHHVVVSLVDPDGPAEAPAPVGTTNGQWMQKLDEESADRLGWPCFGLAGDGVAISSVPVVWAPGQGVVRFPGNSGVPLTPSMKIVVQVHYNLADPKERGKSDTSTVQLQLAEKVENVGLFQLPDALLESLFGGTPDTLQPGKASELYTFKRTMSELDMAELPELKLWGVMPHMHELGHKYQMRIKRSAAEEAQCGVDVQRWNFHWQRMYFYEQPFAMSADAEIEVTCDFDTSSKSEPVSPGWGTSNEMCLATLYFTAPAKYLGL